MDTATLYISTLVTLIAIMDPVGTVGIFIGITPGESEQLRRRQAALGCFWALCFPPRTPILRTRDPPTKCNAQKQRELGKRENHKFFIVTGWAIGQQVTIIHSHCQQVRLSCVGAWFVVVGRARSRNRPRHCPCPRRRPRRSCRPRHPRRPRRPGRPGHARHSRAIDWEYRRCHCHEFGRGHLQRLHRRSSHDPPGRVHLMVRGRGREGRDEPVIVARLWTLHVAYVLLECSHVERSRAARMFACCLDVRRLQCIRLLLMLLLDFLF